MGDGRASDALEVAGRGDVLGTVPRLFVVPATETWGTSVASRHNGVPNTGDAPADPGRTSPGARQRVSAVGSRGRAFGIAHGAVAVVGP
ncbi:hypothetical protein GCM10023195_70820 [Actinoallomurus liliacearum]|uniref:Uncharacterized protein n=1 Tax=Actinoallomurus liliacearum TaxID=1080073 RepID=A0ABP8TWG3_9ACTN